MPPTIVIVKLRVITAITTVGTIVIKNGTLMLYPIIPSCCSIKPSITKAVNSVIGINDNHFTTLSDSLILDISKKRYYPCKPRHNTTKQNNDKHVRRCCHRSITTPIPAAIVEASIIAT